MINQFTLLCRKAITVFAARLTLLLLFATNPENQAVARKTKGEIIEGIEIYKGARTDARKILRLFRIKINRSNQ